MTDSTFDILRDIAENAERDFEQALSLPPAIYHSEEILELERQRLFLGGWICVGRCSEMPQPGDYICYDIVDQPVVVIRQPGGGIRAFPNVCLHRCARLLEGRGHVSKVSCPYHSWTYELDGRLAGAPYMHRTPGFRREEHVLESLPCEVWLGFIYVSLDRDAPAINGQLAGLEDIVADFRMSDYVPVYEEQEVWNTNWKCLVENFMDVYHLHRVHANSFNKYVQAEDKTYMFPGEDAYCWMYVQEDGGEHSVAAHRENTWLKGERRHQTVLFNVYPSHVVQLQPDLLWYLSIMPDGLDRVRIRWAVAIPGEILADADDRESHIREEVDFLKQVNGEDRPAVESVFSGSRMNGAARGPLSWLERNCFDFCRYLARELCD